MNKYLLLAAFFLAAQMLHAQKSKPYSIDTLSVATQFALPYTLLKINIEGTDAKQALPLILFFHGAGERGSDNKTHLTVGLPFLLQSVAEISSGSFYILAPQCPENHRWVDTDWKLTAHKMAEKPYWTLAEAIAILAATRENTNIDSQKIYLTGLSMGGFAAWEMLARQPQTFAAALPICGGGDPTHAHIMAKNNIWAVHGKNDKLVLPKRTTDMIAALKKAGAQPKVTMLDAGHLCWNQAYKNPEIIRWFWQQKR
jgi:predicted peptidase